MASSSPSKTISLSALVGEGQVSKTPAEIKDDSVFFSNAAASALKTNIRAIYKENESALKALLPETVVNLLVQGKFTKEKMKSFAAQKNSDRISWRNLVIVFSANADDRDLTWPRLSAILALGRAEGFLVGGPVMGAMALTVGKTGVRDFDSDWLPLLAPGYHFHGLAKFPDGRSADQRHVGYFLGGALILDWIAATADIVKAKGDVPSFSSWVSTVGEVPKGGTLQRSLNILHEDIKIGEDAGRSMREVTTAVIMRQTGGSAHNRAIKRLEIISTMIFK